MKKILLVLVSILMLCGCSKKDESSVLLDTDCYLKEAMSSKLEFIDESGSKILFKDYVIYEDDKAVPNKYVLMDLDGDNMNELACLTTSYYGAYIILKYNKTDKNVYGYMLGARSFVDLKEDGTFSGSGGASLTSYNRIESFNWDIVIKEIAYYDDMEHKYRIDGNNVTEEEINNYIKEWNNKKSVEWIDYK